MLALVPPKPKLLEKCDIDLAVLGVQSNAVDGAIPAGILQVQRRRRHIVADGEDGKDRLDGPGRAQQVAGCGFGGRHGDLAGVVAEHTLHGLQFQVVAQRAWRCHGR